MIALTQTERMAVELLSGELADLMGRMRFVETLLLKHTDVSDDAQHWLKDGAELLASARQQLQHLFCENDEHGLAVWLEEASLERYCETCANRFEQCEFCKRVFPSRDIVTYGEETGCASCVEPDEEVSDVLR